MNDSDFRWFIKGFFRFFLILWFLASLGAALFVVLDATT